MIRLYEKTDARRWHINIPNDRSIQIDVNNLLDENIDGIINYYPQEELDWKFINKITAVWRGEKK